MSGTTIGGQAAATTNKAKYGADFYSKLGLKGQASYIAKPKSERLPRGFAFNLELARIAGAKGGTISRKKPA